MIDLSLDTRDIQRMKVLMEGFGEEVSRAFARTLNRVAAGIRTDGAKAARQIYNVKARTLRQSFHFTWANPHHNQALIRSIGPAQPLSEFGMRTSSGRTKRGVSVLIKKSTGRMPLRHGFVGKRQYKGKQTIVERQTKARLPLKTLYGPSVAQMLGNPAVIRAIELGAPERFHKNFEHEIQRVLNKARK